MKALSSAVAAATQAVSTAPHYLLQLDIGAGLKLATRDGVDLNGTWQRVDFQVALRGDRLNVTLPNHDDAFGAVALGSEVRGARVDLWGLYGDPPYDPQDPVALYTGRIAAVPRVDSVAVVLECRAGLGLAQTPSLPLALWLGDDLLPPGTTLTWGGGTITLEAADG